DAGRFDDITERVNGGQNGAADRRARYAKALKALGA
ncbi:DNA primase, partial [Xanthomonas perforans]